ncbi:hypothetical protein QBC47DRAFT_446215 [Echria macrotheca]|uniref:Uncharacterized protein n=1 Tax=Echria macrotheca TaxID=438768 RepID=A0AAJ0BCM4_9PEZI|nr:hypothetical protein QBC47DRAFT_446215 [Echria macrotheca]
MSPRRSPSPRFSRVRRSVRHPRFRSDSPPIKQDPDSEQRELRSARATANDVIEIPREPPSHFYPWDLQPAGPSFSQTHINFVDRQLELSHYQVVTLDGNAANKPVETPQTEAATPSVSPPQLASSSVVRYPPQLHEVSPGSATRFPPTPADYHQVELPLSVSERLDMAESPVVVVIPPATPGNPAPEPQYYTVGANGNLVSIPPPAPGTIPPLPFNASSVASPTMAFSFAPPAPPPAPSFAISLAPAAPPPPPTLTFVLAPPPPPPPPAPITFVIAAPPPPPPPPTIAFQIVAAPPPPPAPVPVTIVAAASAPAPPPAHIISFS